MQGQAFAQSDGTVEGYSSNAQYLADELKRLDLLIELKLLEKRKLAEGSPFDQLKGLVISEEEVAELLSEPTAAPKANVQHGELQQLEQLIAWREANTPESSFLGLYRLAHIFALTPYEKDCLLICLAPEIDGKYEKLFAYLQDDVTKKYPTIGLISQLFGTSFADRLQRQAVFNPLAPLFKYKLLFQIAAPEIPFPSRALKLDDHVKDFLIGLGFLDHRLSEIAQIIPPGLANEAAIVFSEEHDQMRQAAVRHFSAGGPAKNLVMFFRGPRGSGKKALATRICSDLGIPLLVADVGKIPPEQSLEETLWFLARDTVLHSSALCLEGMDDLANLKPQQLDSLLKSMQAFSRLTFLLAENSSMPRGALADQVVLACRFTVPEEVARRDIWRKYLQEFAPEEAMAASEALAGKYRFTPGQIRDAASAAINRAHCLADSHTFSANLNEVCRNLSHSSFNGLTGEVAAKRTWADIILPPGHLEQMQEICDQARHRKTVYGDWGFGKKLSAGKGLAVLFSGPSGTGKTLSAEIIAFELQLHLYKIDLSQVVDKYIGETEKNLSRVFSEAERANAILFFDEADALFGKRSETKDAHDRYANIEVGYLLQRIEEYEGIVILATNLVNNMDEAFQRRMNFIIQFPFPDAKDRELIWRNLFPPAAPLSPDLDFAFLAEKLKFCGGNIKNIALTSAFYAVRQQSSIGMKEIMKAAKKEYQKLGKPLVPGDFSPYSDLLEGN